jgi:hypothetical protein
VGWSICSRGRVEAVAAGSNCWAGCGGLHELGCRGSLALVNEEGKASGAFSDGACADGACAGGACIGGACCQIICSLGGVGRARVTCTGYVHRKSLHRAPGAPGQGDIKTRHRSINQPISSMNSSICIS